jgi:dienelactone hydrolase
MAGASAGVTGGNAGTGGEPLAGVGGAPLAGTGGMSGGAAGQGSAPLDAGSMITGDSAMPDATVIEESILPPIDDPAAAGPFGVERIDRIEGLSTHSLFVPDDVALNGKHPVAIWTNGNGGTIDTLSYASFIEHVASHGFLVVADKASNGTREAEVDSQAAAIDWVLAQNAESGGPYFERLDVSRIAVMGHSLGSLASFATASNEHVKTSIHFSGGITDNPVGFDPAWLQQMKRPAAFLCGGNDTTAGPSCEKDFAMAPVPVFYGVLAGASHIGPFTSARGGEYGRAGVAWLRWQLADDPAFRGWFVGSDCRLCASPWTAMQRDLD